MSSAAVDVGYKVDGLAAAPGDLLVAAASNFIGPRWTGALVVLNSAAGGLQVAHTEQLSKGLPSLAHCWADQFTGRRVVAAGGDDGSLELWYLSSSGGAPLLQQAQAAPVLHDGAVTAVVPAPGGAPQLASAAGDGTLRLWDAAQLLACTGVLGAPGGGALNAGAWLDASQLASAGDDGRLCLWDARQFGATPTAAAAVGAPALSLAVQAAGSGGAQPLLVAGDQLGRVSVFDPRSLAKPLQRRQLHADCVRALAAAPGGSGRVASGGDDGAVMLLDCSQLEASRQLAPPQQDGQLPRYARALAWSGDGAQLWRGGWDNEVVAVQL